MKTWTGIRALLVSLGVAVPAALFAGFGSKVSYLAAVGRVAGADGAQFFTTVWVTNLTGAPQNFTFEFLKGGQSNPSPASFQDTLQPGETKVYENVVETKLGLNNALGAARITSSGELFVAERIYNQQPGDDLGNTEGLFFAGVPKDFSISSGQSASIQGVDQGGAENFRYNFALIETGGGSPTVDIQVFDGSGTMLGQKSYPLSPYEQIQPNVTDVVPNIAATNARITATVTHGSGSIILAGAQLANESQDSSGFEMTFPDSLLGTGGGPAGVTSLDGLTGALTLNAGNGISITPSGSSISIAYTGGGGSGITSVTHDASLAGAGTGASPLGIAGGQVVRSLNGLHDNLTLAAGSNVTITPNGSTLTIAASGGGGGGLTLPFGESTSATAPAFEIDNTGTGVGIYGHTNSSFAVRGISATGDGVSGESDGGGVGVYGQSVSSTGVSGQSTSGYGVYGTSTYEDGIHGLVNNGSAAVAGLNNGSGAGVYGSSIGGYGVQGVSPSSDGVFGTSVSFNGVEGNVTNTSAGVAGVNKGTGPGIYGENDGGGYAGDFYGSVIVGGDITYSGSLIHSSDVRFKKNVDPLTGALDGILRLRGVTFDWRADEFPRRRFSQARSIGFIAQEVETVFPGLVSTDGDGFKGVDYAELTPILVEAIKAQERRIDDQRRQIENLTRRLQLLESAQPEGGVSRADRSTSGR